jgi:hypothetical protein
MDRLNGWVNNPENHLRIGIMLMFLAFVSAILIYKSEQGGWFTSQTPMNLKGSPRLVFFNRYSGCDCVLEIYEKADAEILAWPEKRRRGIELVWINLDKTPQMGRTYRIVRAPTLLLINENGVELLRQENGVDYYSYFDLPRFEKAINELNN